VEEWADLKEAEDKVLVEDKGKEEEEAKTDEGIFYPSG